jgi:hypothetical protein
VTQVSEEKNSEKYPTPRPNANTLNSSNTITTVSINARNNDYTYKERPYKSRLKCLYSITEPILPSLTAENNYYRFNTISAHSISAICRRRSKPSVTKKWSMYTTIQGIRLFVHNNTGDSTLWARGVGRAKKWGSEGGAREKIVSEERVMRVGGRGSEKERINVQARACVCASLSACVHVCPGRGNVFRRVSNEGYLRLNNFQVTNIVFKTGKEVCVSSFLKPYPLKYQHNDVVNFLGHSWSWKFELCCRRNLMQLLLIGILCWVKKNE